MTPVSSNEIVTMLRCLVLPIIIASFLSQPTRALPGTAHKGKKPPASASLQLTTSVVQQELCENGALRVWLHLRYTNIGTEPIILGRFSATIYNYSISRNERAAAKGDYEMDVRRSVLTTTPNPTHGRTPPKDRFMILNPGESHDINPPLIGFILIRNSKVGRFRKGNHVLQVRVSTWIEPVPLAQELSVIWRKYGVLWWQDVTSEPMPFKIEKSSSITKCS